MMKERPILMSAPMVRALLAGTKTQTRRAVKLPHNNPLGAWEPTTFGGPGGGRTRSGEPLPLQGSIWHTRTGHCLLCPYGAPGDRLWVRETWARDDEDGALMYRTDIGLGGDADDWERGRREGAPRYRWRPSIHMPRWASRITLEITDVRVELLQDISEADAIAEGIEKAHIDGLDRQRWKVYQHDDGVPGEEIVRYVGRLHTLHPVEAYQSLWLSINGAGTWAANPWVWVVCFKMATKDGIATQGGEGEQ